MSAILIRGTVVSIDSFRGQSKTDGKPFAIHTCYVVNGSGAPIPLKVMGDPLEIKQGQKIEMEVASQVYKGEVSFRPVQVR